jgi:CheY-like chemotaxis protein
MVTSIPKPDLSDWVVLMVDDEPDSLNLLSDIMEAQGATIFRAPGGSECLVLLEQIAPTLIILDLAMPSPDGWELLEAIRANPRQKQARVVAVTAFHSASVEQAALRAGFDAFIPKPLKVGTLIAQLKAVVG